MKKGFTLIELLIVVAIIAILAAIAVPNFLEAQTRSKVARVNADQRSIATGLETYYLDNNQYPAHHGADFQPGLSANILAVGSGFAANTTSRTFALSDPNDANVNLNTMTSPISYLSSYPSDVFADARGLPFRYFATTTDFVIGSFGPDADQGITTLSGGEGTGDIGWASTGTIVLPPALMPQGVAPGFNDIETLFNPIARELLPLLRYDPTNGTISNGDVFRIKD